MLFWINIVQILLLIAIFLLLIFGDHKFPWDT